MIYAVVPAGGKGLRSGYKVPKQYVKVLGKEIIAYTLSVFQKNRNIDEIVVAAEQQYFKLLEKIKSEYSFKKLTNIIEGGKERQDSVYNALLSLKASKDDIIIIHDAARPLLSTSILNTAIKTAQEHGNAVVCIKARDTLVKASPTITGYVDRSEIYYVQTPQIFKYKDIITAMEEAYKENFYGTDESMLLQRIGKKINIVEGSLLNFKVTTKEDVEIFKQIIVSGK